MEEMKLFVISLAVSFLATTMVVASNILNLGIEAVQSRVLLYVGFFLLIFVLMFAGAMLYDRFGNR